MRSALLFFSVIASLFFAISFVLTFFARDYIERTAQDYVIDKTRRFADPIVDAAEQATQVPGIQLILNAEQLQTARREIVAYRDDPHAYISRLVAGDVPPAADPGPAAPLRDEVHHCKRRIRDYFDHTLGRLLFDLRIFLGSNLAVALLTAACAYWARGGLVAWLIPVALLLLVSLAFSIYMYVDSFSYFKILTDSYIGWGYPRALGIVFLLLFLRFGRAVQMLVLTARGRK
jgi:hypothetical protein